MESKSELKIDSEIEPQIKIEAETEPEATSVVDNFEKMWINAMKKNPSVDNIFNTAFYEGCQDFNRGFGTVWGRSQRT